MNIFGASTSNQQAVDADYMQNYKYIHGKLNIYPYTEDVCNMYNKQCIPQQIHMLLQYLTMDITLVCMLTFAIIEIHTQFQAQISYLKQILET